jgi:hypothetical protein
VLDTRVIFVDGIPGSGKTTLAKWIGGSLNRQGKQCTVYEELCDSNPLRIYKPIYSNFTSGPQSEEFRRRQLQLYREFVQHQLGGNSISVFDSWLFQAVIGFTFLLRMDYSESTDFAFEIMQAIEPLSPIVIFLGQVDVEANWRRICRIRGPDWTEERCGI